MLLRATNSQLARSVLGRLLCLVLFLGGLAAQALGESHANKAVDLRKQNFYRDLTRDVRYYEDKVKRLTPEAALRLDAKRDYHAIAKNLVDFGFVRSTFWLRIPVRNASPTSGTWKLVLDVPNVERMTVWQRDLGANEHVELRRLLNINDLSPFSDRSEAYRNLVADIRLPAKGEADILIAYSSKQATQLPLFIESPDAFYARVRKEDLHNWSLFALLVGMTLISTIFLTALGFGTAGYYGAYILISGLYLIHTDGYSFQHLWPSSPWWNSVAIAPIGMIMVASGSLFARAFARTWEHHPILNRLLLYSAGVALALLAVSFIGLHYEAYKTLTLLFVVGVAVLYLLTGILALRRGQAGSAFFMCGALAINSSIVFGAIGYLTPGNFNQDIAGHFGRYALLFEGIAFSLAILLHILDMRQERDEALRREVATTQEKLAISEALVAAERSHSHAVALAESRREQLATTAHDIQQPLSSLRMAVSRLSTTEEAAAQQVHASFDYLDRLVRTNLEETKPDADRHNHHHEEGALIGGIEEFSVSVVLTNVEAMFRDEATAKGIDLRLVNASARVYCEPLALMRIISNLVSNAVKYTSEGKVLFGCRKRNGSLSIEVHDTGPGMSRSEIKRLLRPYERGSQTPGTGLGLALVRDIATSNGMVFDLKSEPGHGTVATLSLPNPLSDFAPVH